MPLPRIDMSARGWGRVAVFTILGTLFCIAAASFLDSYSFETGEWEWGGPNNVIIPLLVAPPFFVFLLTKLRELAIAHHDLMIVASTDGLTSCLNRRAFTTLVDAYLERTERRESGKGGALLVIDVDHFKLVNDRFGHIHGDEALKGIADNIRRAVREDVDLVGRIGGEEFSVFLPGLDPRLTEAVAERIRASINAMQFAPDGQPSPLSVSVGGATFEKSSSFSELFRYADRCLYAAKEGGRNRVEIVPVRPDPVHPPPPLMH